MMSGDNATFMSYAFRTGTAFVRPRPRTPLDLRPSAMRMLAREVTLVMSHRALLLLLLLWTVVWCEP